MTPNRCGDCKWYEPTRNPDTGRALPSKDGKCNYLVILPNMPKCFLNPYMPQRTAVWRECTVPCQTWAPKAAPKAAKLPRFDL
jgi:hypothetical protein